MDMNANRHKKKQRMNTHHDAKRSKKCKHVKNAPYFWNDKFSSLKARTVHVHGAGKSP